MNELPVFLSTAIVLLGAGIFMLLRARVVPEALVLRYRRVGQFVLVVAAVDAAISVMIAIGVGR